MVGIESLSFNNTPPTLGEAQSRIHLQSPHLESLDGVGGNDGDEVDGKSCWDDFVVSSVGVEDGSGLSNGGDSYDSSSSAIIFPNLLVVFGVSGGVSGGFSGVGVIATPSTEPQVGADLEGDEGAVRNGEKKNRKQATSSEIVPQHC